MFLKSMGYRELASRREHPVHVGLVTNQTGVDARGARTVDVLAHAPGIKLKAIFSPEHGICGCISIRLRSAIRSDAATGVPIYSVYGDTDAKRRPTAGELAGVDAIVYRHPGYWRALLHLREHAGLFP